MTEDYNHQIILYNYFNYDAHKNVFTKSDPSSAKHFVVLVYLRPQDALATKNFFQVSIGPHLSLLMFPSLSLFSFLLTLGRPLTFSPLMSFCLAGPWQSVLPPPSPLDIRSPEKDDF